MNRKMSTAVHSMNQFSNRNEETSATKIEKKISSKKITAEHNQEESVLVNQSRISGEIRTLKRRHVLHSPQIVITCPADDLAKNAICTDCSIGPSCCVDIAAERDQKVAGDEQNEELHSSGDLSNSDGDDGEHNKLCCCDCGTSISSNSDYSTCSSEDGRETVIFGKGFSRIAKYTSVDNLCEDFAGVDSTNQTISDTNWSFDEQLNYSLQSSENCSSNSSEYDEDDEEVIIVEVDNELRDVVDNHIRSRKSSYATSSDSESVDSGAERYGSSNKSQSSKESEILQRFLEQVETHPQEEDLDVILEIVGEEEDEPSNRSKVNIRECTEKFKEIYAKKLKEIYHNKYRSEQISHYNVHSKNQSEKSEPVDKNLGAESEHKNGKNEGDSNIVSEINSGTETIIFPLNKYGFTKTDRTMIDKLPEIRQFHPNNIDHKIPFEERSYLKATSLINEIESCFMETAYLVEKSIGSDKPSPYVLKIENDVEASNLSINFDEMSSKENVSENVCSDETSQLSRENIHLDSSSYQTHSYHIPNSGRIVNEFQTIWENRTDNKSINGNTQVVENLLHSRESNIAESASSTSCISVNRYKYAPENEQACNSISDANSASTRVLPDTDRVPRTLEESIDIFEIILEDRRREHRKSYDSELSSSTLVLNSSRFFEAEKLKEISVKFNSTDNILDDTNETRQFAWRSGRNSNSCASALVLQDYNADQEGESINETPKYKSSYDLRFRNHSTDNWKQKSYKDSVERTDRKKRNTYHKYDTYYCYTDDESYIATNRKNNIEESNTYKNNRVDDRENESSTNLYQSNKDTFTHQHAVETLSGLQIGKDHEQDGKIEENISSQTLNDARETVNEDDVHLKIATCRSQTFNKWKSEPDFGRFSYPLFGFQSSFNEEYVDRDYATTSLTTSMIKTHEEMKQSPKKENAQPAKTFDYDSRENDIEDSCKAGTIQILSEQPLFSQVDELLKDLLENHVDSNTSDYDEGVVSDQSDLSDQNEDTRGNNGCYTASQILSAINGTDGDIELEDNIIQIVRGINSISEKHLGQRIEEELEKLMKPKIETLYNNVDSNIRSSAGIFESKNGMANGRISSTQYNESRHLKDNLTEEIKRISALPEISDIMTSIKHDSPKFNRKSTFVHELTAMEQISQASNELRSLGLHGLGSSAMNSHSTKFPRNVNSSVRPSRKTIHERQIDSRKMQNQSTNVLPQQNTERNSRSSSCFSYFEDRDPGLSSDCSEQKVKGSEELITSTETGSECFPGRNSFILKMLHENLRCYVITLAFLEKLLTDDETKLNDDGFPIIEELQESITRQNFCNDNTSHCAIECIDPTMLTPYTVDGSAQSACRPSSNKVCSPCDVGHKAFLLGLQRKHQMETLPS